MRLVAARRGRSLTQQELCDRADIHVTQLRRYEAGSSEPSLQVLRRLAMALSITTDELLFNDDRRPDDPALALAFEAAAQLGPEEQRAVILVVEGLTARAAAVRRGSKSPRK